MNILSTIYLYRSFSPSGDALQVAFFISITADRLLSGFILQMNHAAYSTDQTKQACYVWAFAMGVLHTVNAVLVKASYNVTHYNTG